MEKPRSILKKKTEITPAPHVTFNEDEITEYDKQRGQKMKIDEPKTPYEYSDEEKKTKANKQRKFDLEQLNKDLEKEVQREVSGIEEAKNETEKHKKFMEKRRQHYKNEFHKF